jgi:NAD(P)-dependent dehydrogenase (short-subunit alcohol dehydrogenase family)
VLPRGGSLTFVADTAGLTGEVWSPAFCAAAAALVHSTDDLADVLRAIGARLNTVVAELSSTPPNRPTLGAGGRPRRGRGRVHALQGGHRHDGGPDFTRDQPSPTRLAQLKIIAIETVRTETVSIVVPLLVDIDDGLTA